MNTSIKLNILAGKASLQPPIGPILGQYGIPGRKFCQDFNDQTKSYNDNTLLTVKIHLYNKKIKSIHWLPNLSSFIQRLIFPISISNITNKSSSYAITSLPVSKSNSPIHSQIKNLSFFKKWQKLIWNRTTRIHKYRSKVNAIYIEDIYYLRKIFTSKGSKVEEINTIKQFIGTLNTMQILIIKKNV